MFQLTKLPAVDRDLAEAALWYALRDMEVAERFIDAAHDAITNAALNPLLYSARRREIRSVRIKKFPHSVYFVFRNEAVLVIGILHGARQLDRILKRRLSSE